MSTSSLKAGLIQQACTTNHDLNLDATCSAIQQAAASDARLIVLQELFATRYFCQSTNQKYFRLAETIPGPTVEKLATLAAQLKVVIVTPIFERRAAGLYHNTAVVIEADGSLAGKYRKMHIPEDPGYHEKYYFTPGDLGFTPIDTSLGRLGILICWDQWFPEAARLMALAGAEILIYPTAIGWDPGDTQAEQARQLDAWQTIQRGHAIANALPLISCNRTGFEDAPTTNGNGINFWGSSFICGPQGEILAQGSANESTLLLAEITPGNTELIRQTWPFLRDRRVDAYAGLTQILVAEN